MAKVNKAQQALRFVKQQSKSAKRWTDLHNAFYGIGGKFQELFPTQAERVAFTKTDEFREIGELIRQKQTDGEAAMAAGEASGKFVIRLPTSLHAALVAEAEAEGVSLNQLCLAKLAAQLRAVV